MKALETGLVRLRALEESDVELLYRWENDSSVWRVSDTIAPFSRHQLREFIENQRYDIYRTRQMRLVIETLAGDAVGTVDLFDFDPVHARAADGILIFETEERNRGYAADALDLVSQYARDVLHLQQLYCDVETENGPSLSLFRGRGFEVIGTKKRWLHTADGWADVCLLQRLFGI